MGSWLRDGEEVERRNTPPPDNEGFGERLYRKLLSTIDSNTITLEMLRLCNGSDAYVDVNDVMLMTQC